ncbi:hypothetical protein ACFSSA_06565 [Luteolibacter algae]|uniref:Uncharacterized protein n=1 Tax=Luteolibacter algae TaxID=454151 RepID=A0ABW5D9H9_9BACT
MLEEWIAASRDRFTNADFDFITEVFSGGEKRACLAKLWEDPNALREMLDLKEVLRGLLDSPSTLQVSPDFYFYVLVRHAFVQADIANPDIADYVAAVLAERLNPMNSDPLHDISHGYTHAGDFLAIISHAHGRMKFRLQVAAGNQFLVLTGLFPSYIENRCQRRGAPDIRFYESFAQRSYSSAANNSAATGSIPRKFFGELAESLPQARRSLNRIAEEYIFLGD